MFIKLLIASLTLQLLLTQNHGLFQQTLESPFDDDFLAYCANDGIRIGHRIVLSMVYLCTHTPSDMAEPQAHWGSEERGEGGGGVYRT